ncbi:hypothetical protein ABH926_006252 [Catenulispora sp. GP43]|uniref:hypothetical protein n=1 Tax=Catenulispora sp. GP43 TaxID=3156263 RepID=UPI00351646AB
MLSRIWRIYAGFAWLTNALNLDRTGLASAWSRTGPGSIADVRASRHPAGGALSVTSAMAVLPAKQDSAVVARPDR